MNKETVLVWDKGLFGRVVFFTSLSIYKTSGYHNIKKKKKNRTLPPVFRLTVFLITQYMTNTRGYLLES